MIQSQVKAAAVRAWQIATAAGAINQPEIQQAADKLAIDLAASIGLNYGHFNHDECTAPLSKESPKPSELKHSQCIELQQPWSDHKITFSMENGVLEFAVTDANDTHGEHPTQVWFKEGEYHHADTIHAIVIQNNKDWAPHNAG